MPSVTFSWTSHSLQRSRFKIGTFTSFTVGSYDALAVECGRKIALKPFSSDLWADKTVTYASYLLFCPIRLLCTLSRVSLPSCPAAADKPAEGAHGKRPVSPAGAMQITMIYLIHRRALGAGQHLPGTVRCHCRALFPNCSADVEWHVELSPFARSRCANDVAWSPTGLSNCLCYAMSGWKRANVVSIDAHGHWRHTIVSCTHFPMQCDAVKTHWSAIRTPAQ